MIQNEHGVIYAQHRGECLDSGRVLHAFFRIAKGLEWERNEVVSSGSESKSSVRGHRCSLYRCSSPAPWQDGFQWIPLGRFRWRAIPHPRTDKEVLNQQKFRTTCLGFNMSFRFFIMCIFRKQAFISELFGLLPV